MNKATALFLPVCLALATMISGCKTPHAPIGSHAYIEDEFITVHNGNVVLSHLVKSLFHDDFHTQEEHWQTFLNHENRLLFTYGEHEGKRGLVLSKDAKASGHDTAFELRSKRFEVVGGSTFTFTIVAFGSVDLIISSPFGDSYFNLFEWYDKDGKFLSSTPFKYSSRPNIPTETKITGTIPPEAANAVIRIGADRPNILTDDHVVFMLVDFSSQNPNDDVHAKGSFISRPFYQPVSGKLSWKADLPSQTSVSLQIATASDKNGVPGEWSAFVGPGNNPLSFFKESDTALPAFSPSRPWVRYKATLRGLNEHSPTLKSVTIGNYTDGNWQGKDMASPDVARVTPACPSNPSDPVSFRITDDTLVNWSSARLFLDGRDVTSQTSREKDELVFHPNEPLRISMPDIRDISTWRLIQNHHYAISFTDIPNGVRFARQGSTTEVYARLKSPEIVVTPGETFTFSIRVRGTAANDGTDSELPVSFHWCGERGAPLGNTIMLKGVRDSADWLTCSMELTVPNGAHKGYALILLDQNNLQKGTFIEFSTPKLTGKGWKPQELAARNLHKFTVVVNDLLDHETIKDFRVLVNPEPRTQNIVTLRHDGTVLVDGKPFFPIGMYAVWKRDHNAFDIDKAFEELHEVGFNLAHSYNATRDDEYKEFMDAALKHDVKLFIPSGKGVNSRDIDEFISDIANERNHPAVLAWYLADDTASFISAEDLAVINEAIHDADPTRITVQADALGHKLSRYTPFVNSTDGFLPELYPVTNDCPPDQTVPEIVSSMKLIQKDIAEHAKSVKTIWPIIQYFKGWGAWTKRFPTFEELRAMTYEAIIHGGNGVTFYTYISRRANNFGVLATDETWDNMKTVAGELRFLSPVFLAERPEQIQKVAITSGPLKDAQGNDAISTLYKHFGNKHFLICANSALETVAVNCTLPNIKECTVLFEDRTLQVEKGRFSDTFAPYAVHVYELK